jgi:hypothetical protein
VDFWILFKLVDGVEDMVQHPLTSNIKDVSVKLKRNILRMSCISINFPYWWGFLGVEGEVSGSVERGRDGEVAR